MPRGTRLRDQRTRSRLLERDENLESQPFESSDCLNLFVCVPVVSALDHG